MALTIPGRVIVGMALDRFGPRRVFSILMVVMAIPTWFFAFGDSAMQLFVSRLFMSIVGAGFVVGIHMTALWFKPKDIGFAEGFMLAGEILVQQQRRLPFQPLPYNSLAAMMAGAGQLHYLVY